MNRINKLDNKIKAIFVILLILNVILWIALFTYSFNGNLKFTFSDLEGYATIASVLIIFGFISSRLPKLRALGDSALYEIAYLLIMGLLSLCISYFNSIANDFLLLEPFIDMFMILAIVLIIMILTTKLKWMRALILRDYSHRDQIICMVIFIILGVFSTVAIINYGNFSANVRTMTIMIAGMFGGPIVGIPTAIVAGTARLFVGGKTAVPCAISTYICGFLASAIYLWNGKRFLRTHQAAILMFLFVGVEMLIIFLMNFGTAGSKIVYVLYAPMAFAAVIGIILFRLVIAEARDDESDEDADPETEIKELKNSLKKYEERIQELEEKLKESD